MLDVKQDDAFLKENLVLGRKYGESLEKVGKLEHELVWWWMLTRREIIYNPRIKWIIKSVMFVLIALKHGESISSKKR